MAEKNAESTPRLLGGFLRLGLKGRAAKSTEARFWRPPMHIRANYKLGVCGAPGQTPRWEGGLQPNKKKASSTRLMRPAPFPPAPPVKKLPPPPQKKNKKRPIWQPVTTSLPRSEPGRAHVLAQELEKIVRDTWLWANCRKQGSRNMSWGS